MLTDLFSNKKIWTIIFILIILFTIVGGLRYMGLYEGMEANSPAVSTDNTSSTQQLATTYNF
jgi:flagellar basal body-associated protein FliL